MLRTFDRATRENRTNLDGNAVAISINVDTPVGAEQRAPAVAPSTATLIKAKIRFFTPMIVIYMVGYIGLTALAGFAQGFMAVKVVGALNIGFLLIAGNYVLSLIIALAYIRTANTILDPMVQNIVADFRRTGAPR
jgi:uncharacterized membrane protein (DUF485 family)